MTVYHCRVKNHLHHLDLSGLFSFEMSLGWKVDFCKKNLGWCYTKFESFFLGLPILSVHCLFEYKFLTLPSTSTIFSGGFQNNRASVSKELLNTPIIKQLEFNILYMYNIRVNECFIKQMKSMKIHIADIWNIKKKFLRSVLLATFCTNVRFLR